MLTQNVCDRIKLKAMISDLKKKSFQMQYSIVQLFNFTCDIITSFVTVHKLRRNFFKKTKSHFEPVNI